MRIDGRKLALKEEGKVAQDNSRLAGEVRGLKAQVRTIPSSSLSLPLFALDCLPSTNTTVHVSFSLRRRECTVW